MHDYMKSIGFSKIEGRAKLEEILMDAEDDFTEGEVFYVPDGEPFVERYASYAEDVGIMMRGTYDDDFNFLMNYYFPSFRGTGITTKEPVTIEKFAEKDAYAGICEDMKVGVSLIFYVINAAETRKKLEDGNFNADNVSVTLSGLASTGTVLFPIDKNEEQLRDSQDASDNRRMMLAAAQEGDEEAIENLTMDDIDMYTTVSRRIQKEDLFSIVDTYFMPYGIECDKYSIMGEILEYIETENEATGEELYIITLEANELEFDVVINKKDVLGELAEGRRFKCVVWLQGYINFD